MALQVFGEATITHDPTITTSESGSMLVRFPVASYRPRKREGENDFFYRVLVITKPGARAQYFRRGDIIFIRGGTYEVTRYTQKDGQEKISHTVVCMDWSISGPYRKESVVQRSDNQYGATSDEEVSQEEILRHAPEPKADPEPEPEVKPLPAEPEEIRPRPRSAGTISDPKPTARPEARPVQKYQVQPRRVPNQSVQKSVSEDEEEPPYPRYTD